MAAPLWCIEDLTCAEHARYQCSSPTAALRGKALLLARGLLLLRFEGGPSGCRHARDIRVRYSVVRSLRGSTRDRSSFPSYPGAKVGRARRGPTTNRSRAPEDLA